MSQPSGVGVPRGDDWHRGAASPPDRGLAERQEVTASRGARDPARRDDGLGRWGAGSLARFEPSALHGRLSPPPQSAHFGADAAEVDEVRELSAHLSGFIGRARALEQRSLVLRHQLEKARRLAQLSGPDAVYSEYLGLTEQRLDDLKAEERRLRRELEAARGEETDYKRRWKSESDNLQRLREDLERLSHDAHEALSAHLALQIETQVLMEDAAFTRDAHKQHLSELRESVELVGQMMSSNEGLSPDVLGTTETEQLQHEMGSDWQGGAGGSGDVHQQQGTELRVLVDSLSSQQRALQDECKQLERNLREAEGASEAELSRATAELQAHRVELAQALGALRSKRAENERLWASTRDLESELERYRRAIENEDSRLHSVIIGAVPATVHTLERRCVPELVARELGRGAQADADSVFVRARGRKLAESTSPTEDPCSGHTTAPGEDVFETEGHGKDRWGKTGMETWTGRKRNEEEEEEDDDEAGDDVPDGVRFSRAYSRVKDLIREKIDYGDAEDCVSETSSSEEDIAMYTMPSSVCVTGHGSWPQPSCYYEPSLGHVTVMQAEVEDELLIPLPSLGPLPAPPSDPSLDRDILIPLDPMLTPDHVPPHTPAPPSVPDTEQRRESREPATPAREGGEQEKDKGEKGKDKGPEASRDADRKKCDADNEAKDGDKTSIGKTPPSPPQETMHDVEKTKSATDLGSRALGRAGYGAAGEFTSSSISYEKLEVMESTETTVDDKRHDYEEKSLVIETSVERKETFSSH
ncbi:filensin [Lampetra fluviatilis]